jgi:hypothetical protein
MKEQFLLIPEYEEIINNNPEYEDLVNFDPSK